MALLHVGVRLGLFWTSFTSGPNPSEPQADLAALLATKGVPSQLAADREAAALKKLGHSAVRTALGQTNPWAALKALTTRPGLLSICPEVGIAGLHHLQATKHGTPVKRKKTRMLLLDPAHFVDDEADQVSQILLSQVVENRFSGGMQSALKKNGTSLQAPKTKNCFEKRCAKNEP